jgi:hypothetical protein
VSYTTNNGKTWSACSGIPAGAIVRSDRVNANKFYGFKNGTFYVSTNGGASFTAAATGLPTSAQFKATQTAEGHIWLAAGTSGLWRSNNSGTSFTKLTNVDEADVVGFGKAAIGQTYPAIYTSAKISGVRGIYRSDVQGANWIRINDDQHQYAWTGKVITGDPRIYGRVYFGTNGRGIIYGDIKTQTAAITATDRSHSIVDNENTLTLSIAPNPSKGNEMQLRYTATSITNGMRVRINDANGRIIYIRNIPESELTSNQLTIRFPQKLSQGIYFVTVSSGGKTNTMRLLVE